ncbi:hypothetical protein WJX84_010625 [Apatococcus fuscideae]|uniref:DUF6729 domain-containing protein n=1 Tax=Apatococcus fuscideae TaxID=2026836 RepID=A0AAW1TL11_9CHLO
MTSGRGEMVARANGEFRPPVHIRPDIRCAWRISEKAVTALDRSGYLLEAEGQAEVKEERNEHIKKFCEAEVSCLLPPKQASAASNWSPATPWRELPNALLLASQYPVDSHGWQDRSKGFLPTNKVHWLTGGLRVFFWCPVRFFGRFMQLTFGQQNFYPPCPHCHTNCDVGADGWIAYPRRFHTASGHSLLYSSQWRCKCGGPNKAKEYQFAAHHDGVLAQLPPCIRSQFPAVLTAKAGLDASLMRKLQIEIAEGESMANFTNTLNELHHMEFLERELVYLDIQRLLAPVPPQRGDIRGFFSQAASKSQPLFKIGSRQSIAQQTLWSAPLL